MSYPNISCADRWKEISAAIDNEDKIISRCRGEVSWATFMTIQTVMPHIRYWMGIGLSEFIDQAIERQVSLAGLRDPNANKYLVPVRVVWGDFKKDQLVVIDPPLGDGETKFPKWVPRRSAEKYASVLRHLIEEGVKNETIAEYIRDYNHETHGKGLSGIVAADRAKHGVKRVVSRTISIPCPGFANEVADGEEILIRAKKVGGRIELQRLVSLDEHRLLTLLNEDDTDFESRNASGRASIVADIVRQVTEGQSAQPEAVPVTVETGLTSREAVPESA